VFQYTIAAIILFNLIVESAASVQANSRSGLFAQKRYKKNLIDSLEAVRKIRAQGWPQRAPEAAKANGTG
jgi:hypothetical protein